MITFYFWNENTHQAAKTVSVLADVYDDDDGGDTHAEAYTNADEAIEAARAELARTDPRPGGAAMAYRHRCARAILNALGEDLPA